MEADEKSQLTIMQVGVGQHGEFRKEILRQCSWAGVQHGS